MIPLRRGGLSRARRLSANQPASSPRDPPATPRRALRAAAPSELAAGARRDEALAEPRSARTRAGSIGTNPGTGMWRVWSTGATLDWGKWEKTLEIVGSDASSVSVKLDWGEPPYDGGEIDGDYTATYCGDAPP